MLCPLFFLIFCFGRVDGGHKVHSSNRLELTTTKDAALNNDRSNRIRPKRNPRGNKITLQQCFEVCFRSCLDSSAWRTQLSKPTDEHRHPAVGPAIHPDSHTACQPSWPTSKPSTLLASQPTCHTATQATPPASQSSSHPARQWSSQPASQPPSHRASQRARQPILAVPTNRILAVPTTRAH